MALVHLVRIYLGWSIVIDSWSVPIWVSWIGFVVAGGLAYLGLRAATPTTFLGRVRCANQASQLRSFRPIRMTMMLGIFSSGYMLVPLGVGSPSAIANIRRGDDGVAFGLEECVDLPGKLVGLRIVAQHHDPHVFGLRDVDADRVLQFGIDVPVGGRGVPGVGAGRIAGVVGLVLRRNDPGPRQQQPA